MGAEATATIACSTLITPGMYKGLRRQPGLPPVADSRDAKMLAA